MKARASYTPLERFLNHWDGMRMVLLKQLCCFGLMSLRRTLWPGSRTAGEKFHHIGAHLFYAARGFFLGQRESKGTLSPDADWELHKHLTIHRLKTLYHWLEGVQKQVRTWAKEASASRLSDFVPDNPWHEGMRGWLLLQHVYQDKVHYRSQFYGLARQPGLLPPDAFAVDHLDYWSERKWK